MEVSSRSTSSFVSNSGVRKVCEYRLPAKIFKSKTEKNPNRRFFGCQLYKKGGNAHCKFFRWLDEEVIGWPKRALVEAQSEIKEKTKKIKELNATIWSFVVIWTGKTWRYHQLIRKMKRRFRLSLD
ncbi:unnamed protein product [Arabidopsis lyrata]|uniref:GRF-type domain-containing protein n=1 Tax=Arabidopsis lyrata subsp. lyrata TaxID=81972 RepID=D7LBH9_ARALL|nr:hypothetical protein ARALYDRAFT_901242 [Arabidopsis lyrata subsp. lyrata]CAH8263586.1 unnamed protein product [Arabidopsis lyrata]